MIKKIEILLVCLLIYTGSVVGQQRKNIDHTADAICVPKLSDRIEFKDHQRYLLIENYLSGQRYIYWKQKDQFDVIKIDTNLVRRIYLDYFEDTAACIDYMSLAGKAQFKPRIVSLCPYDDTTVLACMETFKADTIIDHSQLYSRVYSILEMRAQKPVKLFYVNKALPVANSSFFPEIFSYKKTLYFSLSPDTDTTDAHSTLYNLAKMKKRGSVYSVDKMPTTINDYLITNKVFHNYNAFHADNGYALMSLSDYILNLDTEERILLPIADSIFSNLRIDPQTLGIGYYVSDFKYNTAEHKFYIRYSLGDDDYAASYKPHATAFDSNVFMYAYGSEFGKNIKAACLSWDGKRIMYSMKGDSCFRYATPAELQTIAEEYKKEF